MAVLGAGPAGAAGTVSVALVDGQRQPVAGHVGEDAHRRVEAAAAFGRRLELVVVAVVDFVVGHGQRRPRTNDLRFHEVRKHQEH